MAEDNFWNTLDACTTPEQEQKVWDEWAKADEAAAAQPEEEEERGITISSAPDHTPTDIATSVAFSVSTWGG